MTDQAREAFEKHIAAKYAEEDMTGNLSRDEQGDYIDDHVHIEFVDWQAAYSAGLSAGREQAAQAVCPYCGANELPFQLERGGWFHTDADGNMITCRAYAIRALGATQPEVK